MLRNQKIHINKTIRIATPIPIQISILKLEHVKYRLAEKTSEAILKMEIINKGTKLEMELNAICYNLQIMNTLYSKGTFAQTIKIKPTSSLIVDIPLIIEYISPFKTAWQIVTDNDVSTYDLNILFNVTVNSFESPYMIPVEVDVTGTIELIDRKE